MDKVIAEKEKFEKSLESEIKSKEEEISRLKEEGSKEKISQVDEIEKLEANMAFMQQEYNDLSESAKEKKESLTVSIRSLEEQLGHTIEESLKDEIANKAVVNILELSLQARLVTIEILQAEFREKHDMCQNLILLVAGQKASITGLVLEKLTASEEYFQNNSDLKMRK